MAMLGFSINVLTVLRKLSFILYNFDSATHKIIAL